jgi:ATP-dependent Clp protease ATP-binding subunit ClpA
MGFDLINGARPMARVIEDKIKIPLAELMLKKNNKLDSIKIDFCLKNKKFKFSFTDIKKKSATLFSEG